MGHAEEDGKTRDVRGWCRHLSQFRALRGQRITPRSRLECRRCGPARLRARGAVRHAGELAAAEVAAVFAYAMTYLV